LLAPLGQHRELAEAHAELALALAEQGKVDEAERYVLEAQQRPTAEPSLRVMIIIALASIRTAQEREEDAEALYNEALTLGDETDFAALEAHVLQKLIRFLADRGRSDDAARYEKRLAELIPVESTAEIA
jgi:tetratricopeptide (TPR) repeat protein